jgi:hypothetical protein
MNIYEFHVDIENKEDNESNYTYYHLMHKKSFTKEEFLKHIKKSYEMAKEKHPDRLLVATGVETKVYIESRHILDYMIKNYGYVKVAAKQRIELTEIEIEKEDEFKYEIEKETIDESKITSDFITYPDDWIDNDDAY